MISPEGCQSKGGMSNDKDRSSAKLLDPSHASAFLETELGVNGHELSISSSSSNQMGKSNTELSAEMQMNGISSNGEQFDSNEQYPCETCK